MKKTNINTHFNGARNITVKYRVSRVVRWTGIIFWVIDSVSGFSADVLKLNSRVPFIERFQTIKQIQFLCVCIFGDYSVYDERGDERCG